MDPRKSKGGSSSSKSRGLVSRSQPVRPIQVQSQPAPYYPQMSPQPSPYYPQMSPQPYYQNQYNYPQPPPFEPYGDYRETTSRREPSFERSPPLYHYPDAEEDEFVPETQPQDPIGFRDEEVQEQDVRKKKQANKAEKITWSTDEEVALAKGWVHISTYKIVGNEQTRDGFWKRILEHFKQNVRDTHRSHHSLNTKWQNMNAAMNVFNGLYIQQKRLKESGCSDVDIMKNVLVDYNKKTGGKSFGHIQAWEIVKNQEKWLEQPCVGQGSSSHSDKRRKSSESGDYESASNDNVDTILPDLNDDSTPTRQRKGKRTASQSTTKASVAASFDTYTTKKAQLLEEAAEKKRQKDELAEQLLAAQLRSVEENALFRAMRFNNQPHDNITDPNMLAFTLSKKRELAAKYGWICDF